MKKKNMMLSALALTAFILAPSGTVVAEQITIPVGSQTDRASISIPQIGMSQASVRAKWGAPMEIRGPLVSRPSANGTTRTSSSTSKITTYCIQYSSPSAELCYSPTTWTGMPLLASPLMF
ncbi:hypothetical protein [Marinobacter similis]|uniref:hypothetical protein n=1 Tax=Marinobacter similis TaxID=1420916 RepID=UPI001F38CDF9|nr:hypothetical protein [Marinobacter similis]